ncbi:MAG: hypothetical protein ACFE95_08145 [Candidatus Hodarchaeota archaeon]
MYFTLFPPITIDGSAEKALSVPGIESLKKALVSSEKFCVVLEIDGNTQTFDIIKFNSPSTDVHDRIEPDDDMPLELYSLCTIEFFEDIAKHIGGYTLISSQPPESGYFEIFRGDRYPVSVRGSDKQLYATTAEIKPLRKDYVVSLKSLLQVDFEEQLGNSLATFVDNVLKPMTTTMNEVFALDKGLSDEDSIVNIIGGDFKRLITRTEELISIVNYNMEQTAERNKAFLRLTLPLMLKQALLDNFGEYFQFVADVNSVKLVIQKRKTITAEEFLNLVVKFIR